MRRLSRDWLIIGWAFTTESCIANTNSPTFPMPSSFMATAAPMIEKMDHHPEWQNVYNRVTVDLNTHSAGGITQKDFDLAALLEGIAKKLA